jgi:hypothetical protein
MCGFKSRTRHLMVTDALDRSEVYPAGARV